MFDKIIAHVKRFVPLSPKEEEILCSYLKIEEYAKKKHLLEEGEMCTGKYFVNSGVVRMYTLNEKGVEQVIHFAIEGWWITDYFTFNTNMPAKWSIQAVEPAQVVVINAAAQEELLKEIPQMERYFRLVLEKAYAASLMRTHYMFNFSAEERYRHFSEHYPEFVQRVPQYLVASYLGFTPEFLSMLRAKKG
ncbi:Crp/Fnr family transcriptional regulator [Flavobacterium beibuense]|uniref:Crp/Fnr family transcriptional regulator n=1 Tax=Flavobacterium beibuense TaxID=657326 RepID=UPI003A9171B1